jgi:hypothetical protein
MAAILADAEECLTAAAAAAFAAPTSSSGGNCLSRDQAEIDAANNLLWSLGIAAKCVVIHGALSTISLPSASGSFEAALPSAPAAVRLSLTVFQTCSRLQEMARREDSPAPVSLLALSPEYQQDGTQAMGWVVSALLQLAVRLHQHGSFLHSKTGAHELLLCPPLIPALASTVLVAVLGFDTCAGQATANDSGAKEAVRPASSSRRNVGSSSSTSSGSCSTSSGSCSTASGSSSTASGSSSNASA